MTLDDLIEMLCGMRSNLQIGGSAEILVQDGCLQYPARPSDFYCSHNLVWIDPYRSFDLSYLKDT